MQWNEAIKASIEAMRATYHDDMSIQHIQTLVSMFDLTSLNTSDSIESITEVCKKAITPYGPVAAVCFYPQFIHVALEQLAGTSVQVATVINFPEGNEALEKVMQDIGNVLAMGATELDVVFPYSRYLAGERQYAQHFVSACKTVCGEEALLKVILETGVLNDPAIIADATYDVFTAGADFVKTSTGKIPEGASLEAAATMLLVIEHLHSRLNRPLGIKIAGGIKTLTQAMEYMSLANIIMGEEWISPSVFRIGTSQLIDQLGSKNSLQ